MPSGDKKKRSHRPEVLVLTGRGSDSLRENYTAGENSGMPVQDLPKKRCTRFQGAGRIVGSSSTSEPVSEGDISSLNISSPLPSTGVVVDQSLPSTSIQLRLIDGTRIVAHFNYNHTVAHIRSFIDASGLGGTRNYQLRMVGFPPKVLTDPNQTIEQAGLLNSVVIQKL